MIEQLIKSLLDGYGINPDELIKKAETFMAEIGNSFNELNSRLSRIERELGIIEEATPDTEIEVLPHIERFPVLNKQDDNQ